MSLRNSWVAMVGAGILDAVTTVLGLHIGLVESNIVVASVITSLGPITAMILVKFMAILFAYFAVKLIPKSSRGYALLCLTVVWGLATLLNVTAIAIALF